MIRAEITQVGEAGAADELVASVFLDDNMQLSIEPAREGIQLEWIRQLVVPERNQPDLSLEKDPLNWVRALPRMLHDPHLLAEIVEDDFVPCPDAIEAAAAPALRRSFEEVLKEAIDSGALHPSVAAQSEGDSR